MRGISERFALPEVPCGYVPPGQRSCLPIPVVDDITPAVSYIHLHDIFVWGKWFCVVVRQHEMQADRRGRVGADVVSIIKESPPLESVLSVAVSQRCGRMTVFGVKVMACPVGVVFKATNQTNYYLLPRSKRIIPWWIRQKPVEV